MNTTRRVLRAGAVLVVALAAGHLVQTIRTEQTQGAEAPRNIEAVSAGPEAGEAVSDLALPAAASLTGGTAVPSPASETAAESSIKTATDHATAELSAEAPELTPSETPAVQVMLELPASTTPADPSLLTALGEETTVALPKDIPPALAVPQATGTTPETPAAADCTPALSLAAEARAMIAVTLSAPCHAGQRVVLRHAGLAVAERLDAAGGLALDLPALNEMGEVSILFADADFVRGQVLVPDATTTRRFVVQWMAGDSFQLHAMEAGATYGEPGHVSAQTQASPNGGYILSLGDPGLDLPMMAEVYTWPVDATVSAQPVVEAAITDGTCDRELLGETILASGGQTIVKDLTVAMPGCDAVGDILVLNNLLGDVTLAAAN